MSDNIEWFDDAPHLRRPVAVIAFEGWNDAAEAATGVIGHLLEHFGEKTLARLDIEQYVNYQDLRPQISISSDGRQIDWPATGFWAVVMPEHSHDLVLVIGDEPHRYWRRYCTQLEEVLQQIGVKKVVTLGAFLGQIPHTMPVQIFGIATDPDFTVRMNIHTSEYEGPTGITGVLHHHLADQGMEAASLWAGVPHYLAANPSPTTIRSLLQKLGEVIGWEFNTDELDEQAAQYEESIRQAVNDSDDFGDYVRRLEEESDHLTLTPRDTRRFVEEIERFLQNPS